jgi:glycosyltransferase involved in cell wall biosynthesis
MPPKISVIIPTYNNALLLPQTLNGVLNQSFKDMEIIVIDDGSKDQTYEMIRSQYPGITCIHQSNKGPAAARNTGARLAKGEFIAFCDHDDVWNAQHLECLLNAFAVYPSAGLVFDNAEYFGKGINGQKLHLANGPPRQTPDGIVAPRTILWDYPVASMSVVMVKKQVFDGVGGLSESVGALDDLHFYLRVAARYSVRYIHYTGCRKRVTGSNLSQLIDIKETNVRYLEDLWTNHPSVVDAVGSLSFRFRLARKYFKLGRQYLQSGTPDVAKEMFWKAYSLNWFNPRYLWSAASCGSTILKNP